MASSVLDPNVSFIHRLADRIKQAVYERDDERVSRLVLALQERPLTAGIIIATKIATFLGELRKVDGVSEQVKQACKQARKTFRRRIEEAEANGSARAVSAPAVVGGFRRSAEPIKRKAEPNARFKNMAKIVPDGGDNNGAAKRRPSPHRRACANENGAHQTLLPKTETHATSSELRQQSSTASYNGKMRRGPTRRRVLTLQTLCQKTLGNHLDMLEYVGDVPFDLMQPVLQRMTPQQLQAFLEHNPELQKESDPLWKEHFEKDFKNVTAKPEELSWQEFYHQMKQQKEERYQNAIKRAANAAKQEGTHHTTKRLIPKHAARRSVPSEADAVSKPSGPTKIQKLRLLAGSQSSALSRRRTANVIRPVRVRPSIRAKLTAPHDSLRRKRSASPLHDTKRRKTDKKTTSS